MKIIFSILCFFTSNVKAQQSLSVMYPVYKNGKMGYINKEGKILFKCDLETEDWYELKNKTEEVFAAKNDKKYYLANRSGDLVIKNAFKNLFFDIPNKLIRAELDEKEESSFGFGPHKVVWLNYKGEQIMPNKFDCNFFECGYNFNNNLFVFTKNEKRGAVNRKGEIIIEPKYKDLTDFKNGYSIFESDENGKFGIISQNNKILISAKYERISNVSEDGYFFAMKNTPTGKLTVVVNMAGKELKSLGKLKLSYAYTTQAVYNNNVAVMQDSVSKLFALVDRMGNIITKPKYAGFISLNEDNIFVFNINGTKLENDAWFERTGGNWVLVDGTTGKEIGTPIKANKVKPMQNGLAAFEINDKWGFINNLGKITIEPKFTETPDGFDNELCRLIRKSKEVFSLSEIGYINKKGEFVWPVQK